MSDKYYVYELIDPNTKQPFYVGKGCGNRVKDYYKFDLRVTKATQVVIESIRLQGKEIESKIVAENLSEDEALDLESQLIRKYGRRTKDINGILTNVNIRGGKNKQNGIDRYATIQITRQLKDEITQYCHEHNMFIGKFVGKLFTDYISGSVKG
jgi:hypothetical protein